MIIEAIEAQKIVNRLMSILGKNINIMNRDGIIIASGEKSRIGDFHGAALDAVEQRSEVIVSDDNLLKYKGSKTGVNIPIYYKSDVLGVVGITGEPSEVKGYALIVKELVELMIQEEERRNLELFQSRAVKSFVKELIKYHSQEDYDALYSRAKLVQFNADIQRTLILVDITDINTELDSYSEQLGITVQRLRQRVVDEINSVCDSAFDMAVNIIENQFVIFKSSCEDLHSFCHKLNVILCKQLDIKPYISVGGTCKSLGDYHNTYLLARHTLEVGRKLDSKKLIYFAQDYKLQLLLQNINKEEKRRFLESFGHLFSNTRDENTKEILNTIKVFFENKMSIKDTASALFVHRNTVLYRINKFTESFHIDVTDPYQCMLVYIALNLL